MSDKFSIKLMVFMFYLTYFGACYIFLSCSEIPYIFYVSYILFYSMIACGIIIYFTGASKVYGQRNKIKLFSYIGHSLALSGV